MKKESMFYQLGLSRLCHCERFLRSLPAGQAGNLFTIDCFGLRSKYSASQ